MDTEAVYPSGLYTGLIPGQRADTVFFYVRKTLCKVGKLRRGCGYLNGIVQKEKHKRNVVLFLCQGWDSDDEVLCYFTEVWLPSQSPSLVDSWCCQVIVGEREVRNFVLSSAPNLPVSVSL